MRKRICLLIFLVLLLIIVIHFTDGSYRPFVKLTQEDIATISLSLGEHEAHELEETDELSTIIGIMRDIEILFSASPDGDALAVINVSFTTGQTAQLTFYGHCLSIDDKCYSISESKIEEMLARLTVIS